MPRLLPLLPSPYDLDALNRDLMIKAFQGDTLEFLFIAETLEGDAITSEDSLKITLADGTQEGTIIWEGSWSNTVAETTSETPNVHRVVIPYSITKTLREGAYAVGVAAEITADGFTRNQTLANGTVIIEATPVSNVRRHPYTGWTQVADFCQTFEIEQAVTPGVTQVALVIPTGCVLKDVTTLTLSGFDPTPLFDIVVTIAGIVVYLEDAAAGTSPKITFTVVKTNVDEASPN